ncbi:MAG: hypothetical protein KIT80_01325 [Chitinophagaceae bacterium]|nr:hypothetical protein [Chitinophagaceae bacterium]MCW5925527.1 hypothetical protein [Chitinophagaceae bacterium]
MKQIKLLTPTLILFVLLAAALFFAKPAIAGAGLDPDLLAWGNLFLFVLSVLSFLVLHQSVKSPSPQTFIRYFYISFLVKFVLVAGVVLAYAVSADKVNRLSVIICMALYLVYTFIELRIILKESKQNNAR